MHSIILIQGGFKETVFPWQCVMETGSVSWSIHHRICQSTDWWWFITSPRYSVLTLKALKYFISSKIPKGFINLKSSQMSGAGALVQWLKLPAWKVGHRGCTVSPVQQFKFQRNKMFLPCSLVKSKYCGEHPWPRGSVLGPRPPGLEFRMLCLEGSVISFISPSSGGSPGPV